VKVLALRKTVEKEPIMGPKQRQRLIDNLKSVTGLSWTHYVGPAKGAVCLSPKMVVAVECETAACRRASIAFDDVAVDLHVDLVGAGWVDRLSAAAFEKIMERMNCVKNDDGSWSWIRNGESRVVEARSETWALTLYRHGRRPHSDEDCVHVDLEKHGHNFGATLTADEAGRLIDALIEMLPAADPRRRRR